MSVSVPLVKTKPKKKKLKPMIGIEVNAYDIILGKIQIEVENIPYYIQVLKDYERKCSEEHRYIEAQMALHKQKELKNIEVAVETEKANNTHLKEKIDIEEA